MMRRCFKCTLEYSTEFDVCPHCGHIADSEEAQENPIHLKPGTILSNRYIIGPALGQGGFAITYRAFDTRIQKTVALKEYFPFSIVTRSTDGINVTCATKSEQILKYGTTKMLDEARSLSKFSDNDNIVDITDYFTENLTAYIVMEYLEGETLQTHLKRSGGRIEPEKAIDLIMPVLNGLSDMHRQKLIHRDVAPDNIFICNNGKVKLLDFGTVRLASEDDEVTRSVSFKNGYAPLEQYASRSMQGPWTDIYAVCATLYKMITGETPTVSTARKKGEPLKSFSDFGVTNAQTLEKIIFKGLEIEPENRIDSIDTLASMLSDYLAEKSEPASTPSPSKTVSQKRKKNNKKRIKKSIITALIIALSIIVCFFMAVVINFKISTDPVINITYEQRKEIFTAYYDLLIDTNDNPTKYFDKNGYDVTKNTFAVEDINNDGIPELLYNYICGATADNKMFIWSYDLEKKEVFDYGTLNSNAAFYSSGFARIRHLNNKSQGTALWSYTIVDINTMKPVAEVYSVDKEIMGRDFPLKEDTDYDGIIYYTEIDGVKTSLTASEYTSFEGEHSPEYKYIDINWKRAFPETIDLLISKDFDDIFIYDTNTSTTNNFGNSVNDGLIAEDSGFIYYQNHDDNYYIYKTDGTANARLNTDNSWCINVYGNFVYYANVDDSNRIYRIDKNGNNKKQISNDSCSMMLVNYQYIYYINASDGNRLYRMKPDGTENQKLTDIAVASFTIHIDTLYFCGTDSGIYSLKENYPTEQLSADKGSYINTYKNKIYYINDSDKQKIYSMKLDGSDCKVICEDSAAYLNIKNGNIYYQNKSYNNYLYRLNITTGEKTALNTFDSRYINHTNNFIYYRKGKDITELYSIAYQ